MNFYPEGKDVEFGIVWCSLSNKELPTNDTPDWCELPTVKQSHIKEQDQRELANIHHIANELRIGNLVYIQAYGNKPQIVDKIDSEGINGWMEHGGKVTFKYSTVLSITLTEEWLLKFGFEKGTDLFEEYAEYEKQFDKGKSITISHKFECYQGIYSQEIKSVHQLQNLYFALTGEELTTKNNGS